MVKSGKEHEGQQNRLLLQQKKGNMDPLLNERDMEEAGDLHLGLKSPAMPGPRDQSQPK